MPDAIFQEGAEPGRPHPASLILLWPTDLGSTQEQRNFSQVFIVSRRKFFRTAVAPIAAGVIAPAVMLADEQPVISRYFEARKLPVSPPGSIGTDRFSSLCTACHLCIDICPTQVLYPSLLEYGVGGIFQPRMNYSASFCNYDCVLCSEVCPSGAILPVTPPQKKEIQLGRAVFVKDDCIVITKKKDCGACSEHCPTKAVKMVPYEKRFLPEVNNEICVGCGACEHSCPTQPRRAIYIQPHAVHRHAKKPEVKKLEPAFDSSQEFPF